MWHPSLLLSKRRLQLCQLSRHCSTKLQLGGINFWVHAHGSGKTSAPYKLLVEASVLCPMGLSLHRLPKLSHCLAADFLQGACKKEQHSVFLNIISDWCSPICLFFLLFHLPEGDLSAKILLPAMSEILLLMFSSRIFVVLWLTFNSFIHF